MPNESVSGWVTTTVPTGRILSPGESIALRDPQGSLLLLDWLFDRYAGQRITIEITVVDEGPSYPSPVPRKTIRDIGAPR